MALLDRIFGNNNDYEEDYVNEEDEESEEDEDNEEEDDNPTGFGDDDENQDGYSGSPEVDPNALPFDDMEEDGEDEDGDEDSGSSGEGKSKKKKKGKDKNSKNDDGKTKGKVQVKKNSSKAALRKNALKYGCLPNPEGYCPHCKQYSMFKSMRFGDKMLIEGPSTLILKSKWTTFYCMNNACKHNWKSGWCVRCAGDRYIGKKVPMKRVLNKD